MIDASRRGAGVVGLALFGEFRHEFHLVLNLPLALEHIFCGVLGVAFDRIGKRSGDEGTFRPRQLGRSLAKMKLGDSFGP